MTFDPGSKYIITWTSNISFCKDNGVTDSSDVVCIAVKSQAMGTNFLYAGDV